MSFQRMMLIFKILIITMTYNNFRICGFEKKFFYFLNTHSQPFSFCRERKNLSFMVPTHIQQVINRYLISECYAFKNAQKVMSITSLY